MTNKNPATSAAIAAPQVGVESDKKMYRTAAPSSILFDVQIHNQVIYGQWCDAKGVVEFHVPDELAAGFEKHWHFVSGNVVAV